ncbi:VWA domain-containing protein [Cellulomonas soli]|uniref:Membrane protein n=1 Tax=Cellulomonas soli TaxID=931535 RepID=A0A512PAQ7_9CELL|nr:VWA domain-containing protein [Cellulomonas soli]NYI57432.1 Ca-activated chloride channel family protein [Cellulomonas soli]GEP68287.1 membrane protein [Cellulomonas soli]
MSLAWPWALAALGTVPLVLAVAWLVRRRRRRAAVTVTSLALVRAAAPGRGRWTRRIPAALLVAGLAVLGVGAARPQVSVPIASNATTILLAFDVSSSMCSTDVDPNRLVVAQEAATAFVESQAGSRIGLVAFSGVAGVLVPPTTDTDALVDAIAGLTTSRGTAIGQAILTSIDAIAEVDLSVAPTGVEVTDEDTAQPAAAIVVLTDGANSQGVEPVTAAEQATARGIPVYTIGFGTTTPAAAVCDASQVDASSGAAGANAGGGGGAGPGNQTIDEATLTEVADSTGGEYYRAENADELSSVLTELPSTLSVVHEDRDVASWFALAGGLLVAAAVALSLWWGRVRAPRTVTPRRP